MMIYNICAVIPIKNFNDVETTVKRALESKSNFIEFRFDYIQNVKDISVDMLKYLKELAPENISLIYTFRDYREGGKFKLDSNQKNSIITKLFSAKPDYIDIEINSEDNLLRKVNDLATDNNVNLIFSTHDFKETKTLEKSIESIELFEKRLELLNFNKEILNNSVLKIIHTAIKFSDNFVPLKL
ncbi:MAG: type I 3-dehydroquinate dehydratase, partial [Promethearchaeota archaeon]